MSKVRVFIHCQVVIIVSVPSFIKINSASRLIKKAVLTAVFTCVSAQSRLRGLKERVKTRGMARRTNVRARLEERARVVKSIAPTWSCTKNFGS